MQRAALLLLFCPNQREYAPETTNLSVDTQRWIENIAGDGLEPTDQIDFDGRANRQDWPDNNGIPLVRHGIQCRPVEPDLEWRADSSRAFRGQDR